MSRIANRIIEIPPQVEINLHKEKVLIKGNLGAKELLLPPELEITQTGNQLFTKSENTALAGTYNSLITNLIEGVTKGHRRFLEVEGRGYEVVLESEKNRLKFTLAKIKPDYIPVPSTMKVKVENRKIIIEGIDNQAVGELAAKIRSLSPPSIYRKRICFVGEIIKPKKRKVTKK